MNIALGSCNTTICLTPDAEILPQSKALKHSSRGSKRTKYTAEVLHCGWPLKQIKMQTNILTSAPQQRRQVLKCTFDTYTAIAPIFQRGTVYEIHVRQHFNEPHLEPYPTPAESVSRSKQPSNSRNCLDEGSKQLRMSSG
ncbi:hypothetical protein BaRGS_00007606 [Batillaria attramentaria]|uniref:Uncharacterized protein n=1 Tax=Batillaria attramentaria TaxID=370345 RepID=A0ABD0LPP7_9CAEN